MSVPVFDETIGGALIDAARINVMAARTAFPAASVVLLPGDEDEPTIAVCLEQAAQWLDAARAMTIEQATAPPTSLHQIVAACLASARPGAGRSSGDVLTEDH